MGTVKGLIARAYAELDYFEKASNSNLDSKTANKGTKNYTKYSRDIDKVGLMGCQGQAWCATFQFWLDVEEFGLETALKHWNMTKKSYVGYNCFETYDAFKAAGKTSKTPKLGCLVIFTTSHMGRVVKIDGDTIWTIEGNTSPKKYERNGGKVDEKSYDISDSKIKGFCIINFEEAENSPEVKPSEVPTAPEGSQNVAKGQRWLNSNYGTLLKAQKGKLLEVDNSYGSKSRAGALCVWKDVVNRKYGFNLTPANENFYASCKIAAKDAVIKRGADGTLAYLVQFILAGKGLYLGDMDAHFGRATESAVEAFQKSRGLSADGSVGPDTWYALFN